MASEGQSRERVLVGLSGGVDSAVAAALLIERGAQVEGATLRLWSPSGKGQPGDMQGLDLDAVSRARNVAERLDVPFHLIDVTELFETHVMAYFVSEYVAGRTPNPCVVCNRAVRFGWLMDWALERGMDAMATGHYARVRRANGGYQLLRGRDCHKDQSYFLHALTQDQLANLCFPLGDLTKREVQEIARRRALPVADQPESQDVCFLVDGDYRPFISGQFPHLFLPGPIRDTSGNVLGQHRGLPGYTIGQRKGLGISAPEPLYVLAIEPSENALVVGPAEALERDHCLVKQVHYIGGEIPTTPFQAEGQIRYRAQPAPVTVTPLSSDRAHVRFDAPQRAITPGQFLVFYDDEVVIGGGVICMAQEPVL